MTTDLVSEKEALRKMVKTKRMLLNGKKSDELERVLIKSENLILYSSHKRHGVAAVIYTVASCKPVSLLVLLVDIHASVGQSSSI